MATLTERLQSNKKVKKTGRHQVLALKNEINTALSDGWSAKNIWEQLYNEERITIKYHQFCRYVKDQENHSNKNNEKKVPGKFYAPKTPLSDEELF